MMATRPGPPWAKVRAAIAAASRRDSAPRAPRRPRRGLQAALPEAAIQRQIVGYLAARGLVFTVSDASRPFGPDGRPRPSRCRQGWPDICGVFPGGRFFGIEVKAARGRLRPYQDRVLAAIRAAGGLALVARSVEEVDEALKEATVGLLGRPVGLPGRSGAAGRPSTRRGEGGSNPPIHRSGKARTRASCAVPGFERIMGTPPILGGGGRG